MASIHWTIDEGQHRGRKVEVLALACEPAEPDVGIMEREVVDWEVVCMATGQTIDWDQLDREERELMLDTLNHAANGFYPR